MFFAFIYAYWCPTRFSCWMILVSFNSNTKGNNSGAGNAYPSGTPEITPGFLWGSCCSIASFLCSVL